MGFLFLFLIDIFMCNKRFQHRLFKKLVFFCSACILLSGCTTLRHPTPQRYISMMYHGQHVYGEVVLSQSQGTLQVSYNLTHLSPLTAHDFVVYANETCAVARQAVKVDLGNILVDSQGNAVGIIVYRGAQVEHLHDMRSDVMVLYQSAQDALFPKQNLGAMVACGSIKGQVHLLTLR